MPSVKRWRTLAVAVLRTGTTGAVPRWVAVERCAAALIFLIFGVMKFTSHAAELRSFRDYPLPAPGFFVYLVGAGEIAAGLLLALGLLTRLAALGLAGDMIGAIAVSGFARGEIISLTLAPLLLAAMITLTRSGGGSMSIDSRLAAKLGPPGTSATGTVD